MVRLKSYLDKVTMNHYLSVAIRKTYSVWLKINNSVDMGKGASRKKDWEPLDVNLKMLCF